MTDLLCNPLFHSQQQVVFPGGQPFKPRPRSLNCDDLTGNIVADPTPLFLRFQPILKKVYKYSTCPLIFLSPPIHF
jgi:hypothetical protein